PGHSILSLHGRSSDLAADFKPVEDREHQIEDQKVRVIRVEKLERPPAVRGGEHLHPFPLEMVGDQLRDRRVVFDDQNAWGHGSRPSDTFRVYAHSPARRKAPTWGAAHRRGKAVHRPAHVRVNWRLPMPTQNLTRANT